ncbi:biopolymer transporter ExbD [Nevskia sp.]|uniref:ExbD/TolR family protein n=1 Tax=Nevskia sp. TaxID=1929292 RepID=UPI0025D80639|nr:biopolymer transporter ExbD [Nevskia sp.]
MQGISRETRRALRRVRRKRSTELNLVSMIDILTVLMFFLLVNSIGVSILGINLPNEDTTAAEPPPHNLAVLIRSTDLALTDNGFIIKSIPLFGGGFDYKALAALMKETKQRLPTESKITLLSEPGVSYEVLVSVMDAVRVDLTATGPNTVELFPLISLGDAPAAAGATP